MNLPVAKAQGSTISKRDGETCKNTCESNQRQPSCELSSHKILTSLGLQLCYHLLHFVNNTNLIAIVICSFCGNRIEYQTWWKTRKEGHSTTADEQVLWMWSSGLQWIGSPLKTLDKNWQFAKNLGKAGRWQEKLANLDFFVEQVGSWQVIFNHSGR